MDGGDVNSARLLNYALIWEQKTHPVPCMHAPVADFLILMLASYVFLFVHYEIMTFAASTLDARTQSFPFIAV